MSAIIFCSRLVVITSFLLTVVQSSSICPVRSLTKLSNEEQRKRHTPLLYWFPGVSAEWVKFLVEQATGHYTGSVVGFGPRAKGPRDCGLHSVLCDGSVDDVNIASSAAVVPIAVTNRRRHRRTIGNGLEHGFQRVILLLYDPYRAMVDDFINIHSNSNNNAAGIQEMNISQSSPFNVTALGDHVLRRAAEYQQTMELFLEHVLREIPSNNITIVRFDDLLNPLLRSQTLAQMLDFLLFPVDNERIHCAFGAAEANTFPLLLPFAHSNTISMAYQSLPVNIECHIKDQLYYFMTKFNYTEQLIPLVTTTATKRTCKISERSQCATRYPPLKFLSRSKTVNKADVLLLSFPGSGNTWLRLLVEHATGYFSGSVDVNDAELMRAMPGESVCDPRVVFVKGHPGDLALNQKNHVWVTNRAQHHKCGDGGILKFTRAIYLIRDARDAMIADFQRHVTQSHTGYVAKSSDMVHKGKTSTASPRSSATHPLSVPSLPSSQKVLIKSPFNTSEFATYIDKASRQYEEKYRSLILPLVANWTQDDLLTIRYEDLRNRTTRTQVLQDVVNFLRLPDVDPSRLHCAFALATTYRRPASDKITAPWAYPRLDIDTTAAAVNNSVVDQRLHAHMEFTQRQKLILRKRNRRVVTH